MTDAAHIMPHELVASRMSQNGTDGNPDVFWYEEDRKFGKKRIAIDQSALVDWLEDQGVAQLFEFDRETTTLVRCKGKILERFPDARIRLLVDDFLRRQEDDRPLASMRRGVRVYLGSDKLRLVQELKPTFQRDTKNVAYFYYSNGFVTVTSESIALSPYDRLNRFIWSDWIIDRKVDIEDGSANPYECDFGRFMWRVSGLTDDADDHAREKARVRVETLTSAIGYMLHSYKDPANARAIIFMDEELSDDPAGGTGKGLTANAIRYLVSSTEIDAQRLNFDSQFVLQSIVPGVTRVVHFNDAGRRFYFDRLFPAITDSLTVERKGLQPTVVPFSESPKFVITTNQVLRGKGGSHERRVFEIEFSPHFNMGHTPENEFGHRLFDDWDEAEWNAFDGLMLFAVQYYLKAGLRPYKTVNLKSKKFARNTSLDFADFALDHDFKASRPGTEAEMQDRYDKTSLRKLFAEQHQQEVTSHKFTTWLKVFAAYQGWEFLNGLGTKKTQFAFVDHREEE